MGILGLFAKTVAKKAVIHSVGDVAVKTIIAISDATEKKQGASKQSKKEANNQPKKEQNLALIRVPRSADEFVGKDYLEIKEELSAYGFTNIVCLASKDLRRSRVSKVGKVKKIVMNGVDDFGARARFLPETRVVITYHEFKD